LSSVRDVAVFFASSSLLLLVAVLIVGCVVTRRRRAATSNKTTNGGENAEPQKRARLQEYASVTEVLPPDNRASICE
jgi:hypothetical protein